MILAQRTHSFHYRPYLYNYYWLSLVGGGTFYVYGKPLPTSSLQLANHPTQRIRISILTKHAFLGEGT